MSHRPVNSPLELSLVTALEHTERALLRRYAARCGWCGSVQKVAVPGSTPMCAHCLDELYPDDEGDA
jgi:hypothetical protein